MCRVPGEETGSILFGAEKEPRTGQAEFRAHVLETRAVCPARKHAR